MAKSQHEIINDITSHFSENNYSDVYVGITKDVDERLFVDHNVARKNASWIYRHASSDIAAREIEQHFLSAGMDGGDGGGDEQSNIVYAYRKTSSTKP